jgi:hypothetical protein
MNSVSISPTQQLDINFHMGTQLRNRNKQTERVVKKLRRAKEFKKNRRPPVVALVLGDEIAREDEEKEGKLFPWELVELATKTTTAHVISPSLSSEEEREEEEDERDGKLSSSYSKTPQKQEEQQKHVEALFVDELRARAAALVRALKESNNNSNNNNNNNNNSNDNSNNVTNNNHKSASVVRELCALEHLLDSDTGQLGDFNYGFALRFSLFLSFLFSFAL